MSRTPLALVVGISGLELTQDEIAFLGEANPYGVFLFRRNIDTPEQVRRLTAEIREVLGRPDAGVFVDEEGGKVQRLDNGNWPSFRPLGAFGALARKDVELARHALRLSTHAMGAILTGLGIDSGTTPVVDLARKGTHDVIGNRAFGDDPELVTALGRVVIDAMLEVGALPIMKHIPGYGRVSVDPHFDCPVVDADPAEMAETDFKPFRALKDSPWAMVAHLIFTRIDKARPASVSPVVCELIRNDIGYDGVMITDCLCMEAIKGTPAERVAAALGAGYDLALLSHGGVPASAAAAKVARPLSDQSLQRITRANAKRANLTVDSAALHAEVERILIENGIA